MHSGVDSLGHEHWQPIAGDHAATLGVEEKLTAMRVVDDVEAGFEMSEAVQIDEPRAVVWIHADGRGVDDDFRVVVQRDVAVRYDVLFVSSVAAKDDDLLRAFVGENGAKVFDVAPLPRTRHFLPRIAMPALSSAKDRPS